MERESTEHREAHIQKDRKPGYNQMLWIERDFCVYGFVYINKEDLEATREWLTRLEYNFEVGDMGESVRIEWRTGGRGDPDWRREEA